MRAILGDVIEDKTDWCLLRTLSFDDVESILSDTLSAEVKNYGAAELTSVRKGIRLALLKLSQIAEIRGDIEVNGEDTIDHVENS